MIEGDIASFVDGYLDARGQGGAEVRAGPGRLLVVYRQPFVRRREWFVWDAAGLDVEPGDWVTMFHVELLDRPGWLPPPFGRITSETFMRADLPLRAEPPGADVRVDGPRVTAFVDGDSAASACWGLGARRDVVVDRVATLPQYRRRGLATALLAAIDGEARRAGRDRMLLISTVEGRPLYDSLGFVALRQVSVFGEPA